MSTMQHHDAQQLIRPLLKAGLRHEIEATAHYWNKRIRSTMRKETRLTLGSDETAAIIKVSVEDGFPRPLAEIVTSINDPIFWRLMLGRPHLWALRDSAHFLLEGWEQLEDWEALPQQLRGTSAALNQSRALASQLLDVLKQEELIKRFKMIDEDVLGAYIYSTGKLKPSIQLYWMPIAMFSDFLGCSAEWLTFITLAHETAHAFTHAGQDIDGYSWESASFKALDRALSEGLAQHYTELMLSSLLPQARSAYDQLLELQGPAYHAHKRWAAHTSSGETLRRALLEARRKGITKEADFRKLLRGASRTLSPKRRAKSEQQQLL